MSTNKKMKIVSSNINKERVKIIIFEVIMFCVVIFMLMPFFWIFSTSLREPKDSFKLPPSFFPTSFKISNYKRVFIDVPFLNFIINSLKVSGSITILQLIICSLASFAFARLDFRGKNIIFMFILSGLMIPAQSTIIPVFLLIRYLGLTDTHWALILPGLISPLGIFLMRQFMLTIPKSYDEAAYIDGATKFDIYLRVILPMSKPSVIVVALMTFISSWNDFFRPLIFLNTYGKMTLPLGLTVLQGYMGTGNLSVILAGITLSLIPALLLYIFAQDYLMRGMILSGLKA
ncbi:MAG: carbohydrate ABC transporter permease [Brevinematia bacterium]